MLKILLFKILIIFCQTVIAQNIKVHAGPEVLHSFNHADNYIGVGGTAQIDFFIKERLWLGVNSGYLRFDRTNSSSGINGSANYGLIPVLGVIKYPLPIVSGLYGQDLFGYSFANGVNFVNTGEKIKGGFTYYFALGYEFAEHFDVSIKVGRSRLDKKDNPANVNEHNLGLKLAYVF